MCLPWSIADAKLDRKEHICARIPGLSEEKGRCKKTQSRGRLFDSDYKSEVWSLQGYRYLLKFIDLQDLKLSK